MLRFMTTYVPIDLPRQHDDELWRIVPEHKTNAISSYGRVWSLFLGRPRKPTLSNSGYLRVSLPRGGHLSVHRLVALVFVPGHFDGAEVNHKDGDKAHNHYSNLEWVTRAENNAHAFATGLQSTKLSSSDIERLKNIATTTTRPLIDIAEEFGVSAQYVGQLLKGKHRGQDSTNLDHRPLRGKLSKQQAQDLISELRSGDQVSVVVLAEKYGVSPANVSNIIAGRTWKSLTGGPIKARLIGRWGAHTKE